MALVPASMPIFLSMENINIYISPELEVLEVLVEQGFEGSDDEGGMGLPGWNII